MGVNFDPGRCDPAVPFDERTGRVGNPWLEHGLQLAIVARRLDAVFLWRRYMRVARAGTATRAVVAAVGGGLVRPSR
jgi:hypothetical protein